MLSPDLLFLLSSPFALPYFVVCSLACFFSCPGLSSPLPAQTPEHLRGQGTSPFAFPIQSLRRTVKYGATPRKPLRSSKGSSASPFSPAPRRQRSGSRGPGVPSAAGIRDEPEGAGQTPPPARVRPADDAAPSTPPAPLTLSLSSRVSRILRSFRDSGLLVCAEVPPAPLLRPLTAPVAGTATTSPLPSAIAPHLPPPNSAPAASTQSTDAPAARSAQARSCRACALGRLCSAHSLPPGC